MLVSYNYLKTLVDLDGIDATKLADTITFAGIEVEGMTKLAYANNLEIGEVIECEMHPDSDHLHVCKVKLGNEVRQIVCGAPNVRKGLKVIVAKEGANLEKIGVVIKKSTIRGVESNGMLCSLLELGVNKSLLSEKQINGIEELSEDAPVGETNVLQYLGLDDVILEIKPTPDRGDVLSLLSLAKEVAACLKRKLLFKEEKYHFNEVKSDLTVSINTTKCNHFNAKRIDNITIKESPKWLKQILISMNIRPINNIVDIGNYVMLLYGRPLHMYDYDKLNSSHYIIRDDVKTTFKALDEKDYQVNDGDIVVCNDDVVSCLGGVMGGYNTMIDDNTKNIVIEAASFNGVSVRRTSRRLNLISDSSVRFVRGIDETRTNSALSLATELVIKLADAKVVYETVCAGKEVYNNSEILLTTNKVNKVLGTSFTDEDIKDVFNRLDFKYKYDGNIFKVVPPSYRNDITIAEDLIEEVIRILGFENLKSTFPVTSNVGSYSETQIKRQLIRTELLHNQIDEALSYTLIDPKYVNDFNLFKDNKGVDYIKILHPMTSDHSVLRKSLIPSLLLSVNCNLSHKNENIALFELSKIYTNDNEVEHLGIVIDGEMKQYYWRNNLPTDFYLIKGIVVSLLNRLSIDENRYKLVRVEENNPYLHPGRSAYIMINNQIVGYFGQIHPRMETKYDLKKTLVCELDLTSLFNLKTSKIKFKAPSIYPSIKRDIALVVDESIDANEIVNVIKHASKGLVVDIKVFDVYQGEHIEKGYKSIALSLTYNDDKHTLKDEEVNSVHSIILEALKNKLNANLRG